MELLNSKDSQVFGGNLKLLYVSLCFRILFKGLRNKTWKLYLLKFQSLLKSFAFVEEGCLLDNDPPITQLTKYRKSIHKKAIFRANEVTVLIALLLLTNFPHNRIFVLWNYLIWHLFKRGGRLEELLFVNYSH